jgi:molybdate transport system substrate-binding protein
MRVRQIVAAAAALLVCGVAVARAEAGGDGRLLVFAAASTSDALAEIGRAFTARTSQPVDFSFGASSDLGRQIAAGAPADAILAADVATIDRLQQSGHVAPDARRDLLSNQLIVIVPADSSRAVRGPRDLVGLRRLALADPAIVPAGVYARRWLVDKGVWDAVHPSVIPVLDVRAARTAVETGAADAAIVYKTDAAGAPRVRVAYEVPRADGPPITYAAAPIAHGRRAAAAAAFVRFLAGPEARAIFTRHGFIVL